MNGYRLTQRARIDLSKIWEYVSADSPLNADRLFDRINESLQVLVANPLIGEAWPSKHPNLRCHTVPGMGISIFFAPTDFGIEVVSVQPRGRDLDSQIE